MAERRVKDLMKSDHSCLTRYKCNLAWYKDIGKPMKGRHTNILQQMADTCYLSSEENWPQGRIMPYWFEINNTKTKSNFRQTIVNHWEMRRISWGVPRGQVSPLRGKACVRRRIINAVSSITPVGSWITSSSFWFISYCTLYFTGFSLHPY